MQASYTLPTREQSIVECLQPDQSRCSQFEERLFGKEYHRKTVAAGLPQDI